MDEDTQAQPTLQEETEALGAMLKQIADADPSGRPSDAAAAAFLTWTAEAGPTSRHPDYFEDVRENYAITDNTNRDLFEIFVFLENHIEVSDEAEAWADEPPKTFITLPLMSS